MRFQDIRYGLRLVGRSPGFAAVTILTLALGIGANAAIFTLLDAVLLRTLPVPHPERLVEVATIYRNGAKVPTSYAVLQQLERNQRVFSALFGWTGGQPRNVEANGTLSLSAIRGVTGNYYNALGATPLTGRLITPADANSSVAVLGYEFWQQRFGGDPQAVGSTIRIENQPFTVIGVSRKWFAGMSPGSPPDVTIPIAVGPFEPMSRAHALLYIFVTGRLADPVSLAQARDQLRSFWHDALVATAPTDVPGPRLESWMKMSIDLDPAATGISRELRARFARPLRVLMGLVALILLVACVNLANLALARVASRRREMSVRVALGASRMHIVRQLLTEQLLLSIAGTALALVFASWASHLLLARMDEGSASPFVLDLAPDWRVFGFAAAVAVATAILIALSPAWQITSQPPATILRLDDRTTSGGSGRLSRGLIVAQIALSLVLLFGAGLLLRTFHNLQSSDPGFERRSVLAITLQARPEVKHDAAFDAYRKQLLDSVTNLAGVSAAAVAGIDVPSGEIAWHDTVGAPGSDNGTVATMVAVSPGWFQTLGIPLTAGRGFDANDGALHPRVAIVDENLARRLQSTGDVVGSVVRFGVQPDYQKLEVVGVARSARIVDLRDPSAPVLYLPLPQLAQGGNNLFVRTATPGATAKAVEAVVQSFGEEYVLGSKTLEQTAAYALTEDRMTAMLSSSFGAMALLLAGIGLFGLMSYTVTRRTREIGIRMALGSQRGAIVRLVLRESLRLTAIGVLIGGPCALIATRLITHMLFGVAPADPLTLAATAGTLLVVGAAAGYWPARRASRLDVVVALRHD